MPMLRHAIIALALVMLPLAGAALADDIYGDNFTFHGSADRSGMWTGPECDNPRVISRVQARFAATQNAYWDSSLKMDEIGHTREIAYRDWTPTITAIRSCQAKAWLSDGTRVSVIYWLRSEQGFAGHGYGVDYCVHGRDWPYAYAPHCRALLPR